MKGLITLCSGKDPEDAKWRVLDVFYDLTCGLGYTGLLRDMGLRALWARWTAEALRGPPMVDMGLGKGLV